MTDLKKKLQDLKFRALQFECDRLNKRIESLMNTPPHRRLLYKAEAAIALHKTGAKPLGAKRLRRLRRRVARARAGA